MNMRERGNPFLKFFDRWVGPLVIGVIAFLRSDRRPPAEITSIGLLKPAAIGDLILVSALISDLRRWNSKLKITLFVSGSNAELGKLLDGVDELVVLPMARPFAAVKLMRKHPVDLLLDCDSWPRITAILCALAPARWKMGFFTPGQYRHYAFDQSVEHSGDQHELDNYRRLLRALNIAATSSPQNFNRLQLDKAIRNQVAVHMFPGGTQSHLKEWPLNRWQELLLKLCQQDPEMRFILTGGPGDIGRAKNFLAASDPLLRDRCQVRAGVTLRQTMQDLSHSRALISVNTGIMHLAAALGVPCVALHGPTNPKRWGPVGPQHQSILSNHPKAGTLNLGFEYEDCEGVMSGISVDQVQASFLKLIQQTQKQNGEITR